MHRLSGCRDASGAFKVEPRTFTTSVRMAVFGGSEKHITGVGGRGSCYSERLSLELSESVLDRLLRAHMNVCLAECPGTHKNGRGRFFSERSSLDQPDPVLDRLLYAQMSVCSAKCSGNSKLMCGTHQNVCDRQTCVQRYGYIYTIRISFGDH